MRPSRILFLIACCLFIGGCSPAATATSAPAVSTNTPTQTPLPTSTDTPIPTDTPTPTTEPTPLGGGSSLVFTAYKSVFKTSSGSLAEFDVYRANPDGSGLAAVTSGEAGVSNVLAGPSPDGSQVLYYSTTKTVDMIYADNNRVELWVTGLNESNPVQLTTENVHTFMDAAVWGDDGTIDFVGWDAEGVGMFHVNPDGSGLARLAQPTSPVVPGKAEILFFDASKSGLYWVTGGWCDNGLFCSAHYFWTALDGSDQQQVWKWLKGASADISLSPDGQWLVYRKFVSRQIPDNYKNGCYVAAADGSTDLQVPGKHPDCFIDPHQDGLWSPAENSIIYSDWNDDLQKFPTHVYSAETNSTTDTPDLQITGCYGAHWLPDGAHVLFAWCNAAYMGYDSPSASRLVDMTSGEVTLLNGTNFCEVSFSPDKHQAFLYNCHSEGVGEVTLNYFMADLDTGSVTELFGDTRNATQKGAWRSLYASQPWEMWTH